MRQYPMTTKSRVKKSIPIFMVYAWVLYFVLIVLFGLWCWQYDKCDRGLFGDMFGGANALFSGLALGGMVIAILLQKKELRLQREELGLTRQELKGQKEQLAAQNATLKKQNFDNTFFQLLRLQNEITQGIEIKGRKLQGRDCFWSFVEDLKHLWQKYSYPEDEGRKNKYKDNEEALINAAYCKFYDQRQSHIGHYFRNLYNVVKFVDKSDLKDKTVYTNIIRAQLSSYELVLLFYNAYSEWGGKNSNH